MAEEVKLFIGEYNLAPEKENRCVPDFKMIIMRLEIPSARRLDEFR